MTRKLIFSLALAPVLLLGCGGNGGSDSSPIAAQHAVVDVAKAAHSYRYLTGMARLHYAVLNSAPTGEKTYDPMLGVDYRVTTRENGSFQVFLTEAEGDQPMGEVRILTADGPPYPVTTRQVINATIDGSHIAGGFDFVAHDEAALSSEVAGQYDLTNPSARVYFDLATTTDGVSGTFGARIEDEDVVDFRDITSSPTFATNANFTVHGRGGAVTINEDGSGQSVASDDSGTYTVRWTADWIVTLVRPDGSSTNLGPISGL